MPIRSYFHVDQLVFKPAYEWAFGRRIKHPETTARAESILRALKRDRAFEVIAPKPLSPGTLKRTHSEELIALYNAAATLPDGETFYPSVFPKESIGAGDPNNVRHAGAFCFDSGTPLCKQTWSAASWSAACAHAAATDVARGSRLAYALSRPPGHHATRKFFGGYSYFNNSAIAARRLRAKGRVALLDIDFHHGNGSQTLFERNPNVLTVSIHGDPREYYPFFCGYEREIGRGAGEGYNRNIPLPSETTGDRFLHALEASALRVVEDFAPDYLVVAAGFDTYERDPVGNFLLTTEDYTRVGAAIRQLSLPTVVVQEGGYYAPHLGRNVVAFLRGLSEGA